MDRLFRLFFWLALLVTLWFAWSPQPPMLIESDKSQHMLAFVVLTLLFFLAYPAARWFWILAALASLGALIEFVQAVPTLHRDSDIGDWYADLAAIALTIALCGVVRKFARRERAG
jgi:cytochrome c oxidase assembly factor CtaG